MTFRIAMRNRGLRPPSVLYPSADGVRLLQHLSQSKVSYTKTTTTAKPPPQPVLWFPNNNADCGGSTKGEYLLKSIARGRVSSSIAWLRAGGNSLGQQSRRPRYHACM